MGLGGVYLNILLVEVKVCLSLNANPVFITDADAFHVLVLSFSAKQNEKGFLIIIEKGPFASF